MDPVCADEDICINCAAIIKDEPGAGIVRLDFDAALPESEPRGWDCSFDCVQKIGAVGNIGAFAIQFLALTGELLSREDGAVLPPPELPSHIQRHGLLKECIEMSKSTDETYSVGRNDQACSDCAQFRCLFVDGRCQTGTVQEAGRREASDSAAQNYDAGPASLRCVVRIGSHCHCLPGRSFTPIASR